MRHLLVDLGKPPFPNLVLMKLSGLFKSRGDEVILKVGANPGLERFEGIDEAHISCVFTWTRDEAVRLANLLPCPVEIGGYGFNGGTLPDEVEHRMPDYSLYGIDYSMLFTSRGCIRKCEFCDVWRKEGYIRNHAPIEEALHPDHDKIMLLDPNFFASPRWRENLQFIIDKDLKVCISQGLDARLVTEEMAEMLAMCKFRSTKFDNTLLYTAWDRLEDEEDVIRGIKRLISAGIRPNYIMVYMLVGFNTTVGQDLYRFKELRKLGVLPFVMPYNNCDHPLKRWGQRPAAYKSCDILEYIWRMKFKEGRSLLG